MAVQSFGQALRVLALAVHAKGNGGQAAIQHPALVRLQDVAEHAAPAAQFLDHLQALGNGHAGHHVAEAGKIFGGGIEHDIGAPQHGVLEGGSEESVVHHHDGVVGMGGGGGGSALQIGHGHGGIGRRFQVNDAAVVGGADGGVDALGIARAHGNAAHAERFEEGVDEAGGAAVEGRGVNDGGVRAGVSEECGHDGSHAGVEDRRVAGAGFERHNLVLQNLGIRMGETGVDEVGALAIGRLDFAGGDGESALGGLRACKNVGGAAKHRGSRRS